MSTDEIEMKLKQEKFGKIKWEKEIWNAAIEMAANKAVKAIGYEPHILGIYVANEIRKLRK